MAGLLDFLSPALSVATAAGTAHAQGKQDRAAADRTTKAAEQASLIQMLNQARQAQQDRERTEMNDLTKRNLESQITSRNRPQAPVQPRTQVLDGSLYEQKPDGSWGVVVQGKAKEEAPPKTISPGQGVLNPKTGKYEVPIAAREPQGDRTLVPVQLEDGSVVYKSRADAEGANAPRPGTQGSATLRKAVAKNHEQLSVIDDALKELAANPQAVGLKRAVGDLPLMGGIADYINQRQDPEGIGARAQLSNVGSLIIHDRSGAAVTISEFPRLAPFVPRVGDTPDTIRKKLEKLKQNIGIETGAINEQLGVGAGSSAPAGGPAGGAAIRSTDKRPPWATNIPEAEWAAYLASKRKG